MGVLGKRMTNCFLGERFISRKGIMLRSGFNFNKRDKLTLSDCKAICAIYCSCFAYASKNDDETGYEIWRDTCSNFIKKNSDDSRYVYIRQSHFESEGKSISVEVFFFVYFDRKYLYVEVYQEEKKYI